MSTITSGDVALDAAPRPTQRSWLSLDLIILVAASLVLALPFLVLHHVNTIDGPGHVLGARLLGSAGNTALVQHYYLSSVTIAPNILTEALLGVLMGVVSPTWSEKLVVLGYIVGFPLAVRFAIRSVERSAGWLALLALPFTVGYLFLYGFYDFCYGMIGAFVAIGLMIRWRGAWSPRRVVALAVVLVVTLAAHIVPWVMACVIIGVLALTDAAAQYRTGTRPADSDTDDGTVTTRPGSGSVVSQVLFPPVLAMVPAGVLTVLYLVTSSGGLATQRKSLKTLVEGLATLTLPIVSYSKLEIGAALLVVLVLVVVLVLSIGTLRRTGMSTLTIGLGLSVLVCILIYFVSPDYIGTGSYLNDRLSLFPPLMLLLAFASVPMPRKVVWRAAGVVGLIAALLVAGIRLPAQVRYDRQVTEYLTVERAIAPNKTLVALRFTVFSPPLGDTRYKQSDPLAHEASRVAADKGDVDLRHFEGQLPYFPHQFRPGLEQLAQRYLNDYYVPPDANLSAYNQDSGRAVDYVLLVGLNQASPQVRNAPATRELEQVLRRDYVHVLTTQPTGLVELYRLR